MTFTRLRAIRRQHVFHMMIFLLASIAYIAVPSLRAAEPAPVTGGDLRLPPGFHANYEFLGTWSVAQENTPGAKELHLVYASPGATADHRKNGKFSDGTVIIKEVRAAVTEKLSSGVASHSGAVAGWFMMVKDSKGSNPGHPLWGEGWGWAWFKNGAEIKRVTTDFRKECMGCHAPARNTDLIFMQAYPHLRQ